MLTFPVLASETCHEIQIQAIPVLVIVLWSCLQAHELVLNEILRSVGIVEDFLMVSVGVGPHWPAAVEVSRRRVGLLGLIELLIIARVEEQLVLGQLVNRVLFLSIVLPVVTLRVLK